MHNHLPGLLLPYAMHSMTTVAEICLHLHRDTLRFSHVRLSLPVGPTLNNSARQVTSCQPS